MEDKAYDSSAVESQASREDSSSSEYESDTNAKEERKDDAESSEETEDGAAEDTESKPTQNEDDIWWEPDLGPDPGFKVKKRIILPITLSVY